MLRARGRGAGIEVWSSGAPEVCCRLVDVEVLRYGALEAVCRCVDVEVFASRAPELWRCTAGV